MSPKSGRLIAELPLEPHEAPERGGGLYPGEELPRAQLQGGLLHTSPRADDRILLAEHTPGRDPGSGSPVLRWPLSDMEMDFRIAFILQWQAFERALGSCPWEASPIVTSRDRGGLAPGLWVNRKWTRVRPTRLLTARGLNAPQSSLS